MDITITGLSGSHISTYSAKDLRKMAVAATKPHGKLFDYRVNFNERTSRVQLICSYFVDGDRNKQSFTTVGI